MNIDEFRQDLRNESMSDADVLNKYILCDNPVIFRDNVGLYSKLKTTIAGHFSVDITSLHMVGSAKLGFSVAPHQLWKPFGEDSDIDIVIISEVLFDGFWQRLSDLSAGIYDRSEQEEHKFHSFLKYFFRGWIRPDFLPYQHSQTREWLDYFKSISYDAFGPYKVTGAIFRNVRFFRKYHEQNISVIRKGDISNA